MSWVLSSRYLAKEWWKVWQAAHLMMPVSCTAARMASCMRFSAEQERSDHCATDLSGSLASGQELLRQGVDTAEVPVVSSDIEN